MIYIFCLHYRTRIYSVSSCLHITGGFLGTRENKKYSTCIGGNFITGYGKYLSVGPKLKSYQNCRNKYYKYKGKV